jgi:hypothetical protein
MHVSTACRNSRSNKFSRFNSGSQWLQCPYRRSSRCEPSHCTFSNNKRFTPSQRYPHYAAGKIVLLLCHQCQVLARNNGLIEYTAARTVDIKYFWDYFLAIKNDDDYDAISRLYDLLSHHPQAYYSRMVNRFNIHNYASTSHVDAYARAKFSNLLYVTHQMSPLAGLHNA